MNVNVNVNRKIHEVVVTHEQKIVGAGINRGLVGSKDLPYR